MPEPLLEIDICKVLDAKVPASKRRFIPGFSITMLEKLLCQKKLNDILRTAYPREGSSFSESVLQQLHVKLKTEYVDRIPLSGTRMVFACNHPLGGLDGIALVKVLGELFGDDNIMVQVNDLLMYVSPLKKVFLPINKFGRQAREAALRTNNAYASDKQICIFPAGLVSRLNGDGEIRDLTWQKAFVAKSIEYGRTVVPVHFEGYNSMSFYRLARLRKRIGIKVNLEQALLPREIFSARGKQFRIIFGNPIPPEQLKGMGSCASDIAAAVKARVYSL